MKNLFTLLIVTLISMTFVLPVVSEDRNVAPANAQQPNIKQLQRGNMLRLTESNKTPQPASPDDSNAKACKLNIDCPNLTCVDGFCCNEICEGNCRSCSLPGYRGTCMSVPNGQDPRQACMTSMGGAPACNATCQAGKCSWPDVGTPCGLCSGCDGLGRCTKTLYDDNRCGVIQCSSLSTSCRTYSNLTFGRCSSMGQCKVNDPSACTIYQDLPCRNR